MVADHVDDRGEVETREKSNLTGDWITDQIVNQAGD